MWLSGAVWCDMDDVATVAAEISQRIAAGAFPDGRLPTERELAAQFNISRSSVRKALDTVEREGRIVRSVGRGTFVASTVPANFDTEELGDISPADLNVARLLIEPAIAEHAALHATAADLQEIERCLIRCENANDAEAFDFWDANLHMAIARATHSQFIVLVYTAVQQVRNSASWNRVKHFAITPDRLTITRTDHRAIVEHILKRDGIGARLAMQRHLDQVGRYIANRD